MFDNRSFVHLRSWPRDSLTLWFVIQHLKHSVSALPWNMVENTAQTYDIRYSSEEPINSGYHVLNVKRYPSISIWPFGLQLNYFGGCGTIGKKGLAGRQNSSNPVPAFWTIVICRGPCHDGPVISTPFCCNCQAFFHSNQENNQ